MQIIVDPVDMETEIGAIPKLIEALKGISCGRGSVCDIRAVDQKADNEDDKLNLSLRADPRTC